jgi:hypothetical protein
MDRGTVSDCTAAIGESLVRPDLSGLGHFADGRRSGVAPPVALSRMAVPVLYYIAKRHQRTVQITVAAPIETAS